MLQEFRGGCDALSSGNSEEESERSPKPEVWDEAGGKVFYRVGGKTVGICVLLTGLRLSPFIMGLGKPTRLTSQSKTSETGSPLNLEPQRQQ